MHSLQLSEPTIIELPHLIYLQPDKSILGSQLIELLEKLMRLIIVNEVEAFTGIAEPLILYLPLLLLLNYLLYRLLYFGVSRCLRFLNHQ